MVEDKLYSNTNFSEKKLETNEFERCTFTNCIFSSIDLSNITFLDCNFDNCDFSLAKIANTALRNIKFKNCKLLGLHFDECNSFLFSAAFTDCILNLSSFYKVKLKQTLFTNCRLHEVEFIQADLTGSSFTNCDLSGAIFENTLLEKVDFRTAYNYSINPENNRIKKAKFSMNGIAGLLDKYNIEIE